MGLAFLTGPQGDQTIATATSLAVIGLVTAQALSGGPDRRLRRCATGALGWETL